MFICSNANLMTLQNVGEVPRQLAYDFLQKQNGYVMLEVQNGDETYHITKEMLKNGKPYRNMILDLSDHVFEDAVRIGDAYGRFLVRDNSGNIVAVLEHQYTYYDHPYQYEGGLDLEFLDQYDCVILYEVNEYSVELFQKALPLWSGRNIVLIGSLWHIFLPYLPKIEDKQIQVYDTMQDEILWQIMMQNKKPIHIRDFLPRNEGDSRVKDGLFCYDEIMTLTFMFACQITGGEKNPDKKFFLVNGFFKIEGIFGIWQKTFVLARYAKKKGYIPAFTIVSSTANMYSDGEGDDIWNKFFLQPEGYTIEEIQESRNLIVSPNANILNVLRDILDSYAGAETQLDWRDGIFNQAVMAYCRQQREKFLADPAHTLGVLIRGTDYIKGNMPGHAIHANVEQVMEKIEEARRQWGVDYTYIYLATEDARICEKMKEQYGNMLVCTDQERFTTKENELLAQLHTEKKQGEGFRLGAEYLATLHLLSLCESLIASGGCNGVTEAIRENAGKYQHVFVFELGTNERPE